MNEPSQREDVPSKPEDAPGHYGAGYGEQVPADATPRPAPLTDADAPATLDVEAPDPVADAPMTAEGDDGAPVVFTPDDVHARPPDHTPTEQAPESEKAGLVFERS
jgi:hypothetical protein